MGSASKFEKPKPKGEGQKLVGYVLGTVHYGAENHAQHQLEAICDKMGATLSLTEWDVASPHNPMRLGLWRAVRRLMCKHCQPIRMSYSMVNFDDFMNQALNPCHCGSEKGFDGLVVANINSICNIPARGARFILYLAEAGKHLYTDAGQCLTCCNPAVQRMLLNAASRETGTGSGMKTG
jgi:hypothetical protein